MKTTLRVGKTGEVQFKTIGDTFEPLRTASVIIGMLSLPQDIEFEYYDINNNYDKYDYVGYIICGKHKKPNTVNFDFSDITEFSNSLEDVVSKLKELKSEILEWYESLACQEIEAEF